MHRPSDQDVNWMSPVQGKSPPVQVKEPYGNLDIVTCRLSSCVYKVHLPIILERIQRVNYYATVALHSKNGQKDKCHCYRAFAVS